MKKIVYLAAVLLGMVSCTSEEYVGDRNLKEANEQAPISFGFDVPNATRAEGAVAAQKLGYAFKVYATKTVNSAVSNVFATDQYSPASDASFHNKAYWVWYTTNTAGTTTSNTHNWEYVGQTGTITLPESKSLTLSTDQTIKYWDYDASQYDFVAYTTTVGTPTITKYTTAGFTVQATPDELAGLYIADKVTVTAANNTPSRPGTLPTTGQPTKIGDVVQFTFRTGATKVRLGIYETIPGYEVKNVTFLPYNTSGFTQSTTNALLSGSFHGNNTSEDRNTVGVYNVTYNATTGIPEFAWSTASTANHFDFGTFDSSSALGVTSTAPTWATGSADYVSVKPNQEHNANMIMKVNYELYNAVTHETIKVKGATAVVPAMYMKWNPNYAYTYLFKISDNTNGTTGTVGTSPAGLYPITFDAVTIAATGTEEGTVTTLSTPSITTYQAGSVSSAGITYAVTDKPIYITVNTEGTLADLTTTNTKLYSVAAGTTEASLMTVAPTTAATGLSILSAAETVNSVTFASGTAAKFTPTAAGTYAVEYTDGDSNKHYKVVVVVGS